MASFRKAGPIGAEETVPDIDDGTLVLALSPVAGPVGLHSDFSIKARHLNPDRGRTSYRALPALKKGDQGKYVRWLQVLLNYYKAVQPPLKEDGVFGPKTVAAVMTFQRSMLLSGDGFVGIQTWLKVLVPEAHPLEPTLSKNSAAAPVADWTLRRRFEAVLSLAPNHMVPELANQFRGLMTPVNVAIISGTLSVWAISHAFGAGETVDIGLLAVGALFLGMAAFKGGEDIGECVMTTLHAETLPDLDRAADYFAQAVAIFGVVAFFSFVARVGAKLGASASAGPEDAAATSPDPAARSSAQSSKTSFADDSADATTRPNNSGPQLRSDLDEKWLDESGNPKWPPNSGATAPETPDILKEGTTIDRYGGEGGSFASTPEASFAQRSLPYDPATVPYQQYEVMKPLPTMKSEAAPWFDQPGGAPQYRFDQSIRDLVRDGFLKPK